MTEAYKILKKFGNRMKQVHVSEVNTSSQHDPISYAAKIAFHEVAHLIPSNIPVIIESRVTQPEISREIYRVAEALPEYEGLSVAGGRHRHPEIREVTR
jgi:predicted transcriptional regulator of viral defense system